MRILGLACFLACALPVGALLAKVWGVAGMQDVALWIALPASVAVAAVWAWARRTGRDDIADALAIGFAAGLVASFAYDIARVPFAMSGMRVFGTISAFGVWLLDARASNQVTELTGWAYHYWNGITFGVMYALMARGRHWIFAIVWACLIETVAIVSPFGRVFSIAGDYNAMSIAYMGHVAYGIPLGLMVQRWDHTRDSLRGMSHSVLLLMAASVVVLAGVYVSGDEPDLAPNSFVVDGRELRPAWLRADRGAAITIANPGDAAVRVRISQLADPIDVPARTSHVLSLVEPGIVQLAILTDRRTVSSFLMLEPVERARR
jgi:hypothetical protein